MNLMVQQFQSVTNDLEEEKTNWTPSITEQENMINEKLSKMEELMKKSRRLDDLIDYHLLSFFSRCKATS